MRLSGIVNLIKEYLPLGILVSVVLVLLFLFGWFILYRKILKGTKILNKKKLVLSLIFLGYLFIIAVAVFFNRYSGFKSMNLHLFASYRTAWNTFSTYEWRNIILNILLFVPMGVFLPLWSDKLKKLWKTVFIGFGMTLLIEFTQYFTGRGIFDVDDIFNNTLGTLIGYGLAMGVFTLLHAEKKKRWKAAGYGVPLLAAVMAFCAIFIVYQTQEFGNLSEASIDKINMDNVELTSNIIFSEKEEPQKVYYSKIASPSETLAFAEAFFKNLETEVDENKTDPYEDTVIYQSANKSLHLWVNYKGKIYSYTDFSSSESIEDSAPGEKKVRLALTRFGVDIPENAEYSFDGNGAHTFKVDMQNEDGKLLNGVLTCVYCTDGSIKRIENNIIAFTLVKECPVISQAEAYEKIKSGDFSCHSLQNKLDTIAINQVEFVYRMDSKGYFQPVYQFDGLLNGEASAIWIPALRR